ncbi:MAG TPA: PEP-CTERM-box response regulator transcription factor [Smithellaceae bacterium]|nr:PEP-CTERM-box response regulator transcription factor [Smithellaceae bacterium]
MKKHKLLIVEDDEDLRTQMKWALAADYEVFPAEDRPAAIALVNRERPAVVTLDLGLPPQPAGVEEGFAVLDEILNDYPDTKVIIITGRGERDCALKAVAKGAYDYFYKPIQIDELKVVLKRAFHLSDIEREQKDLLQKLSVDHFEGMIGISSKMQEVFSGIRKVATTDEPVLITGESGTGKELVARAIHAVSLRRDARFIPINCGAIPENLIESELFGHEKGAFTGAHIQRKGKFEMAHGGTLFLDEVGELPPALQVKLLRFLQDGVVERIGGREPISVDARVLAATNRDLKEAMRAGGFREDLYFRLGVISIALPPLRDRKEDILLLSKVFLERYTKANKKKIKGFTQQALDAIEEYPWPGNVRELENRIKRAVIMSEQKKISPEDMEITPSGTPRERLGLKEARDLVEKELVVKAIARNEGNLTRAAGELGVSRPTLYDLMQKFGIPKE